MSTYRQVHTRIWSDNWFVNLTSPQKLLFMYLFTNERATMSGLYEIPLRIISFDTGLSREEITKALEVFIKAAKVEYDFENGVVWVRNALKWQTSGDKVNEKIRARIKADFNQVPGCPVKQRAGDTLSIPYRSPSDTTVSVSVSDSVSSDGVRGVGEGGTVNCPALYERNFGALTSLIADDLNDLEQTYGALWLSEAMAEAVRNEKRNLKYAAAILKRWKTQGFKSAKPEGGGGKSSPEERQARNMAAIKSGVERVMGEGAIENG